MQTAVTPLKKHLPSIERAHRVINGLKAGTVYVNCYDVFDAASPFGGYKQSGIGVACFVIVIITCSGSVVCDVIMICLF